GGRGVVRRGGPRSRAGDAHGDRCADRRRGLFAAGGGDHDCRRCARRLAVAGRVLRDPDPRRAAHPADGPGPVREAGAAAPGRDHGRSWFLAIFSGSLLAGVVGTLWSKASHSGFFLLLAGLAVAAAALLWRLDRPIRTLP